jgi:hypothetical protein
MAGGGEKERGEKLCRRGGEGHGKFNHLVELCQLRYSWPRCFSVLATRPGSSHVRGPEIFHLVAALLEL